VLRTSHRSPLIMTALMMSMAMMSLVAMSCGSSGGGATSGGSSALPDPCTLVTPTDIATALGAAPLTPPKSDSGGQCQYASASENNYVNVQVEGGQTMASFEKASSSAGPAQRITGLGNEAFQNTAGGSVFVLVGTTYLRIDVFLTTIDPSAVQSLATTAIGRLPS
jgi:hypothetical protein